MRAPAAVAFLSSQCISTPTHRKICAAKIADKDVRAKEHAGGETTSKGSKPVAVQISAPGSSSKSKIVSGPGDGVKDLLKHGVLPGGDGEAVTEVEKKIAAALERGMRREVAPGNSASLAADLIDHANRRDERQGKKTFKRSRTSVAV